MTSPSLSARSPHPSVSVVGAGRLGTVIARALRAAGLTTHGPTRRGEPVPAADVTLLCVPDGEIAAMVATLRGPATLIGHTSGATPLGAADFALHPLQTFLGDERPGILHGIGCAVAGRAPDALATATGLADTLGMRPFAVADEHRATYHAAASVASNYLVTLQDAAERLLAPLGLAGDEARAILAPLVRSTVDNWAARGPEAALTGPIARGDEATVRRQRDAVRAHAAELLPLFDALADRTRALAARTAIPTQAAAPVQAPAPAQGRRAS
ncbi:Rossmann-like and DUF2520 domain-containing protein [Microbacterium sp. No. 7]|uniref:Rossmann-like and DUF2520 domain-containing protein n=1 Tax=Microbacterium sp. No. 7 TaxID=1714373 RepID=UPI0006D276E3|nr:Rossmann-like and DUF2520 domain-containing protein [Microbacterium sp. No. 7]ALJ21323.1 hypothetical protein AOA12_16010 [Microbacterium sp. No. 7]